MVKIKIVISADIRFEFEGVVSLSELQALIDQWKALLQIEIPAALHHKIEALTQETATLKAAVDAQPK